MTYSIIGAGIGGLSTALAFESAGIDYQLFERAPVLKKVGAGIWLAPNALQVLQDVQSEGNAINRISLCQADLTPISDNFQDSILKRFGYSTVAIHRAKLQQLLYDKIPDEKKFLGKSFESFGLHSDGKIDIHFTDNTMHQTDYLIGADGIHSNVRKQLFPNSQLRYSGQTCWRGVANIKLQQEFQLRGMELWGNQIRFGLSKLSDNAVYWFAVALDNANQNDQSDVKEKLLNMFESFHPLVNQLISATHKDEILRNDILDLMPMNKWYDNAICLIGDAAHATTPNMGQGGAQAIEDAFYLCKCIQQHPDKNAFELFQQKRKSKVNTIVKQSWNTGKMAHWKHGQSFRNLLIKSIPKRLLEKKMMEMYRIDADF